MSARRSRSATGAIGACAVALSFAGSALAQEQPVVLRGATVLTASGPAIEGGTVVRSGVSADGAVEAVTKIVLGSDRQREDALDAV